MPKPMLGGTSSLYSLERPEEGLQNVIVAMAENALQRWLVRASLEGSASTRGLINLGGESTAMPASGYYGDYDVILYVTGAGTVYLVLDADAVNPAWQECGKANVVAEPVPLETEDFETLERCRMASGIPA